MKFTLSFFSKLLVFSVLLLIFAGALVTSHGAGLSVPDWPTSYGENMFLFHPSKWIGGILYEHVHRLIASVIGLLTLVICIWTFYSESRKWVRFLSLGMLFVVCIQGALGGLTVLYGLPDFVSVSHAVLGQTFFVLSIVFASSHLKLFKEGNFQNSAPLFKTAFVFAILIYLQLIVGAVMRHTDSGLAITDFPTMGGQWLPRFDEDFFAVINNTRTSLQLNPVTGGQVAVHLLHRLWALVIIGFTIWLAKISFKNSISKSQRLTTTIIICTVFTQFLLGIYTVLTAKSPFLTSIHVMVGAFLLGQAVFLAIISCPFRYAKLPAYPSRGDG